MIITIALQLCCLIRAETDLAKGGSAPLGPDQGMVRKASIANR
jgi:hypothetical protein